MSENTNRDLPKHLDPAKADFDLFISPFYLIAHADFKYHEDLDAAIAKHGLDRATYRLLTVLMRRSPISIKDLAELALIKRSTVSRALDRMRREGWIEDSLNKSDNRITDVYLTNVGRDLAEKMMRLGSQQLRRAVGSLSTAEIRALVTTLQTLVQNLSESPVGW